MKKYRISFDTLKELERLSKEGKSLQEIAVLLGIGKSSVREEYKRCGGKKNYSAELSQKKRHEVWEARREKYRRFFSEEEQDKIREMVRLGATRTDIRKELNASYFAIEKYFNEHFPSHAGGKVYRLENEIECIKQQLEIILDLLRNK